MFNSHKHKQTTPELNSENFTTSDCKKTAVLK